MKNGAFFVLAIAGLVVLSVACEVLSVTVTIPTNTPQPTDTIQPTATEFVPTVTQIVPPTMAAIPADCVSTDTIQYQLGMEDIETRFTDLYKKTSQDANKADILSISADRENMNILIRDTKNLQPSKLYTNYQDILLSEEQAYLNFMTYLLNGDTANANAQLDLQNQYNTQERAELVRIQTYCGVPRHPIQPGVIG